MPEMPYHEEDVHEVLQSEIEQVELALEVAQKHFSRVKAIANDLAMELQRQEVTGIQDRIEHERMFTRAGC